MDEIRQNGYLRVPAVTEDRSLHNWFQTWFAENTGESRTVDNLAASDFEERFGYTINLQIERKLIAGDSSAVRYKVVDGAISESPIED